jgi:small subunit ribosomal protein S14
MAKKSIKARALKRKNLQAKFAERREVLRSEAKEGSEEAIIALQALPRDSSYIRNSRRCNCCGRPRATLRRFGICRICLRKLAMSGLIPGIRKSSW